MRRSLGCLLTLFLLGCPRATTPPGETTTAERPAATIDRRVIDRRVMGGGEIEAAAAPLTDAEVQRAATIATGELRKRNVADARTYFVHAELLRDKAAPSRRAMVVHYRYAGDQTITSIVDLGAQRVLDVRVAEHVGAPLSREEFDQAREMAMADPNVARALGENRGRVTIEPLLLRAPEGDPMFGHRVVRLLFRIDRDYLSAPVVHVDLTERKVLIESPRNRELM
jgi:Cu2+-containing amine oxidase